MADQEPYDPTTIRSLLAEGRRIADDLLEALPALDAEAASAHSALAAWIGVVVSHRDVPDGIRLVCNQAGNEFIDLLYDCIHGRGRPALKSARSLFELLLTLLDIRDTSHALQRYEDHRWVVFRKAAELEQERPVRHKGEAHWRKKSRRRIDPEYDRVIKAHGSRFRLTWRADTLADSASRHGRSAEYEFYRLASAVLHGSSGGVLGNYILDVVSGEEVAVHRTGLALSLCGDAFERGIRDFRDIIAASARYVGEGATTDLIRACNALGDAATNYRDYIQSLDHWLWSNLRRGVVYSIAVIDLRGYCRWFSHDTRRNEVREAEPPDTVPPLAADRIRHLAAMRRAGIPLPQIGDDELVTINVLGVSLRPKPGATWRHAGAILQQAGPGVVFRNVKSDWLDG